jgi:D-alanyl-D-alanine carboxypeptidase
VPDRELTISVLTNAVDGWAGYWLDGVLHIMRAFATRRPSPNMRDWNGR